MKILCPECNSEIDAADINLVDKIAKCSNCNNVFTFKPDESSAFREEEKPEYREIPLPKNVKTDTTDEGYQITIKWFGIQFIFLAFFCTIWDGILFFFIISMLASDGDFAFIPFMSIHILVGIGLTYYTIAGFLNSTTINISRSLITLKSGPVPVPGNKSINGSDIEQLYTKKIVSHGKNGTTTTYEVRVITNDNKEQKLMGNITDSSQALFVEQEIEKYLGIKDRPVRGEFR